MAVPRGKMEKYIRLLQSNYGCIKNDLFYSVTEKQNVLTCMNKDTGVVRVMNKPILKNRLENICIVGESIYMIDMAGKWIAEANLYDDDLTYYEMSYTHKNVGNFAYFTVYLGKIYMIMRHEPCICVFDTDNKSFDKIGLDIDFDNSIIEAACSVEDSIHIFLASQKKHYVFNITDEKISGKYNIAINDRIMYALPDGDKIYLLAGDGLYDLYDNCRLIISIEAGSQCSKICKCNDVFWFLPGKGENIYKYRIGDNSATKYLDYPEDYQYDIPEGWGKFVGKTEDDESIFWCMRAGNYFLKISKKTGEGVWMKPNIEDPIVFMNKAFTSQNNVIKEDVCDFKDYINYIVSM